LGRRCCAQDREDRRKECGGEQDGDPDDEQAADAHRACVREWRGDERREPHYDRQSRRDDRRTRGFDRADGGVRRRETAIDLLANRVTMRSE